MNMFVLTMSTGAVTVVVTRPASALTAWLVGGARVEASRGGAVRSRPPSAAGEHSACCRQELCLAARPSLTTPPKQAYPSQ